MNYLCKNKIVKFFLLLNFFIVSFSYADNHDINDILEQIKKDLQTLERAVYSASDDSSNFNNLSSNNLIVLETVSLDVPAMFAISC